jgi:hypothetical protein
MGYPTTFYPNTRDSRGSVPLRLQEGQELAADFTLVAAPGGKLAVVVNGGESRSVNVEMIIEGVAGSRCWERVETIRGGRSEFGGIPPGSYKILATTTDSAAKRMYAERTVVVGADDSRVELTLSELPVVSGTVTLDRELPNPARLVVGLEEVETTRRYARDVAAEGCFRIEDVVPGSYRLVVSDGRRTIPLHAVTVDGTPAKDRLVEITRTLRLDISATLRGVAVSGMVYRRGEPAAGALVELAPKTESSNPYDYRTFETDGDGSFELVNVPPGEYVLFAVEDWAEFEFANPEAVRARLASGRAIRVDGDGAQTIRLDLP